MLNALTGIITPNDKIVTVEEVAELNPPSRNWVQLVSRRAFRFGSSDTSSISLFDLVRHTLRYRPDYIAVGEVRGEEAYVLFQAIATGHGGLCTMHADSLDHVVKRLTSPPMNVSEVYIPLMNICIYVARVDLPKKKGGATFGRRVRNVWEVVDFGKYNLISEWIPSNDSFKTDLLNSFLLEKISSLRGLKKSTLIEEIESRRKAVQKMVKLGMNAQEVAHAIVNYSQGKPIEKTKDQSVKGIEDIENIEQDEKTANNLRNAIKIAPRPKGGRAEKTEERNLQEEGEVEEGNG
jgi:flagellar protein FlaI